MLIEVVAGVETGDGIGDGCGGVARRFLFDLAWLGHGGSVAEPPRRSTRGLRPMNGSSRKRAALPPQAAERPAPLR